LGSAIKRRAEFLVGRHAADSALQQYEVNARKIAVREHRSPTWPDGVVASITHTNTTTLCVAAVQQYVSYLGIDLENWIPNNTIKEIKNSTIKTNKEKLLQKNHIGFERAFTLAFSAKESLFKALYPSIAYYFDFAAAEVSQISLKERTFELTLA
jgi:enterobactin synthetase component D